MGAATDQTTAQTTPQTTPQTRPQTTAQRLGTWSVDHLEDGLTTLAGQIAAATCRFLEMLAEYDRRRGWARWDCVSAAQWLSWRCQIDPRTAREHLRVAHRLTELPLVTEQFRLGRLSYSKARAITRVATHDNESDLLALARHGTAAQLERAVAAYRRVGRVDDAAIAEEQLRSRRLDWRYEDDGSMVIRVRLPADRGELALTALRAVLDHTTSEADAQSGGESGERPAARDPEIRSVESGGRTDEGKTEATLISVIQPVPRNRWSHRPRPFAWDPPKRSAPTPARGRTDRRRLLARSQMIPGGPRTPTRSWRWLSTSSLARRTGHRVVIATRWSCTSMPRRSPIRPHRVTAVCRAAVRCRLRRSAA